MIVLVIALHVLDLCWYKFGPQKSKVLEKNDIGEGDAD